MTGCLPYRTNLRILYRLAEWCADRQIRLIVDESFADFSSEYPFNTMLRDETLEAFPDLIVVKSISKSYGVPGLRLGLIASSDKDLISALKKDVSIWNLNSFAEFFMQIFSKHESDYVKAAKRFREERDRFYAELKEVPFLNVYRSEANYFLCKVLPPFSSHELAVRLLKEHNILIKDCGSKKVFDGRNYIRIAIRDRDDNTRFIEALKSIAS